MAQTPQPPLRAVAVIAIHGVADQQPGTSVRSIGDLLLRLQAGGQKLYDGFREIALRVPVQPVEPAQSKAGPSTVSGTAPVLSTMNERPAYVLDELSRASAPPGTPTAAAVPGLSAAPTTDPRPPDPPTHHLFQRSLTESYEGRRGSYETFRLEGERVGGRPVHLYELYWADLSRVGQGLLAILGAFYQLALHLPYLGRLAVDHALFEHRGDGVWKWFARVHGWAVRLLTLFLPLLIFFQVLVLFGILPGALPAKPWVGIIALAIASLVVGGWRRYHQQSKTRWRTWLWSLFPLSMAALGGGLGWLLLHFHPLLTPDQLLMLLWIALASLIFFAALGVFDAYRPGARHWGRRLYIPLFLLPMLWLTFSGDAGVSSGNTSRIGLARGVLHVFELQLTLTGIVILAFYLVALLSGLLGWIVVRRAGEGKPRRRARRVAWTAIVSLSVATVLFYTITMLLSWGAFFAGTSLLPQSSPALGSQPLRPLVSSEVAPSHEPRLLSNRKHFRAALDLEGQKYPPSQAKALELLLRLAATSGITFLVFALALVTLLTAWGLAPAVWKEVRPPSSLAATNPRSSESLGRWLDRAFGALAGVLVILYLVTFLISPLTVAVKLYLGWDSPAMALLWNWNGKILIGAGALITASAVGLAFHGRLRSLALGFRPVLDIALDVDSYLRHLPGNRTPRAQMFERYASLLRYLSRWRDENGKGYESIVLVAHSQGSVLTADLLDFLQREGDPELPWLDPEARAPRPRLFLMTMGSPLAQLYARNFPHLYGWISGEPSGWFPFQAQGGPLRVRCDGEHHTGHKLPEDRFPDPRSLGLERWVNVYRSGDYVGRALWRREDTDAALMRVAWDPSISPVGTRYTVSEDAPGRRRELCLGSGAHTHYWDSTADAVAFELDLLIQ